MKISFPSSVIKILILLIILPYNIILSDVRFVSKTGSSKSPYTSWETASDSIQKCINICHKGDTIYVANGTYKEQLIMISGLSLMGAGMDSCIIDTRDLITSNNTTAVSIADSCLIKGFNLMVYNGSTMGDGIVTQVGTTNCLITLNKITRGSIGIEINNVDTSNHSNIIIYKNTFNNVSIGIDFFNSNAIVRDNIIYTYPNDQTGACIGIDFGAYFFNNYSPVLDSNYIETQTDGIHQSFGSKPTISNNTIILKGPGGNSGIGLGLSDSAKVYNNLVIIEDGTAVAEGIDNYGIQHLQLYNNYISGDCIYGGIIIGVGSIAKNNVVTNSSMGVGKWHGYSDPVFQYNNLWNNTVNSNSFTIDSTNISVDPLVVNDTSDFHLQMFSPLIDHGDPTILDKDATRSDIGLYGGPYGERYDYKDLAPKAPRGLSLSFDTNYVTIKWKKNTESDFKFYNLYRDTVAGFTIGDKTLVLSLADTIYSHLIQQGVSKYFYKLTAIDNQGNISKESEELGINITSVHDHGQTISQYNLFQNYPNPFNPDTKIPYRLKDRGYVKLIIYDIKGEQIAVLVNQTQEAGYYEIAFNGKETNHLAAGVYIYQILVKNGNNIPVYSDIKKMIYLK
jgi:hypothetical protein